jgi:hypothetical protein
MREHRMPLNNDGDVVELVRPDGTPVHRVNYRREEAQSGQASASGDDAGSRRGTTTKSQVNS